MRALIANSLISKCLFYKAGTGTASSIWLEYAWNSGSTVSNTMIIADQGASGIKSEYQDTIANVTIVNSKGIGVAAQSNAKLINVLSANNAGGDFNVTNASVSTCCASKDGSAVGTGNRINQSFAFMNEANNDFHLSANDTDARNFGSAIVIFDPKLLLSDDIDGEFRFDGKPDIGADETQGDVIMYTLIASAGDNGSISPAGAVIVNSGANQRFNIVPNIGYQVANVIVDGISQGAVSSYTFTNVMTNNHSISATFTTAVYTITASAGANGAISPSGAITVNFGGSQSFNMTPNNGYKVATVLVDGISQGAINSYAFTNVTTNHTISVTFASTAAPMIITNPVSQMVNVGQTATFSVVASGAEPLTYQWRKNGANIAGATTASYTTPATVVADNNASFSVVVTNADGNVPSNDAILKVNSLPTLISGPTVAPNPVTAKQEVTCVASATDADGDTLIYDWDFGDGVTDICSSVKHTFMTAGAYTVTVTVKDGHGGAISGNVDSLVKTPLVKEKEKKYNAIMQ